MERNRTDGLISEKAVLAGVMLSQKTSLDDALDELEGLATTAGASPVGQIMQRRQTPDKATYLGKGKVEELKRMVGELDADVVIFDNDLSPAQTRNLETATHAKVLDRSELILDIFATRARTYEARLAVELAQLQYSLPRLKRMWTHLSRLKMGIGMRGPGEKQLEVDRRLVEKRIHDLSQELKAIQARKERQVAARQDRMTVSLVGYTNAGKSTLMNALTDAGVLAEDKLFATLDTRTRRWQLPGWGPVLLSDTVGFIRDLPHHLIASFKATLEESRQANLLLHVADASSPSVHEQIASVQNVLQEIGIQEKGTLLVLNKIDRLPNPIELDLLLKRYPTAIPVSARSCEGLTRLAGAVSQALSRNFLNLEIEAPVSDGELLAFLASHGEVLSKHFDQNRVIIHCRLPQRYLGRVRRDGVALRYRDPQSDDELSVLSEEEANPQNRIEDVA